MIRSANSHRTSLTSRTVRTCLFTLGMLSVSGAVLSQSDEEQDLKITVQAGDTFGGILSRELNSLEAWAEIAQYNKLDAPDRLRPGEVLVIPAAVLQRRNYATVVFVKGKAMHHSASDNSKDQIVKGSKVYRGDKIETDTDGFVSVSFNGGSAVSIKPESSMEISALKCIDTTASCEVKLGSEKGRLGLDVKSDGFEKPTVFSIDTPYASAAVRGTKFDYDINDGNILGVTEGEVAISINGSSNNIAVGKGVLAGEGVSIQDVYDLLPMANMRLSDQMNLVSSEDAISWDEVNGAVRYLITYATDEGMQNVTTSLSDTGNITLPDLAPGDYFISTRAVDNKGLRGFRSNNMISSVVIDEDIIPAELDIQISESDMQVSAPDASGVIEVKIGNLLLDIESVEYLIHTTTHLVEPGQSVTIPIDKSKDWYVRGREVIDSGSVSPYGLLYLFESTDQ